jgi:hypothetical protein
MAFAIQRAWPAYVLLQVSSDVRFAALTGLLLRRLSYRRTGVSERRPNRRVMDGHSACVIEHRDDPQAKRTAVAVGFRSFRRA